MKRHHIDMILVFVFRLIGSPRAGADVAAHLAFA
jgi:hypothetical protein